MNTTDLAHNDSDTLEEALAKIGLQEDADEAAGMMVFRLAKEPEHWRSRGITTSKRLWDYLEAC